MDNRTLGPQLIADGWEVGGYGGCYSFATFRHGSALVALEWDLRACMFARRYKSYPGEQIFPQSSAYGLSIYSTNVLGEPDGEHSDGILTTSYARALKLATDARARLLEKPVEPNGKPLTFDDLLERKTG